jgi:hypothetical protein
MSATPSLADLECIVKAVQAALIVLRTEFYKLFGDIRDRLLAIENRIDTLEQVSRQVPSYSTAVMANADREKEFKNLVRSEFVMERKAQEKRKKNVIVTGLVVASGDTASDRFSALCETYLGCKPLLVAESCVPIDKSHSNRVPRLRIVFET